MKYTYIMRIHLEFYSTVSYYDANSHEMKYHNIYWCHLWDFWISVLWVKFHPILLHSTRRDRRWSVKVSGVGWGEGWKAACQQTDSWSRQCSPPPPSPAFRGKMILWPSSTPPATESLSIAWRFVKVATKCCFFISDFESYFATFCRSKSSTWISTNESVNWRVWRVNSSNWVLQLTWWTGWLNY